MLAHSIRNPHIIHYPRWRTYSGFNPKGRKVRFKNLGYLCCGSFTKSKCSKDVRKITCRNCLRKLKKKMLIIKKFADAWKLYNTQHDWFHCRKKPCIIMAIEMDTDFKIQTLEGIMEGKKGDFLLEGVDKEVYPCKREIFLKTYRRAT